MVNAYASHSHYVSYIKPIWDRLPNKLKGEFHVHPRCDGLYDLPTARRFTNPDLPIIVAGATDAKRSDQYIWIEHGAGQTYLEGHGHYPNHPKPGCLAAIVPGPYCANLIRQANPDLPIIEAGAYTLREVIKSWLLETVDEGIINLTPMQPTAVFTWHWRGAAVSPEADTAFNQFRDSMLAIHPSIKVKGHAHPRILGEAAEWYRNHQIVMVETQTQVLQDASLLVADNTTMIYEAAALDIPTVILNPSMYRKNMRHGLRFWDMIPGPQADHPHEVPELVANEIMYPDNYADERKRITDQVYGNNPFNQLDDAVEQLVDIVSARV